MDISQNQSHKHQWMGFSAADLKRRQTKYIFSVDSSASEKLINETGIPRNGQRIVFKALTVCAN
jgi:hypothetical protein